ncbi:ABC transporter ATP-binding protein [Pokkaliibacter sp. MBI-7]|uniref:ABC transporter ATP-binding protein n=1 Tax=Pokkaliibacter sp. MBI-7 TaxID=3040600 RepID=UPI002447AA9E|nr:ABC transporter ATP-binding protein [Pokkaliibacter sp. MBI-7]MDH2434600.1 ABC transporter ATP-binding protein [Pokkaliibacter sp. MBI-7]
MIKVEHLSRRYGDFVAVNDVSFQIGHGEIVGLLGHNGAGKTTIMKMITGYLEPSDGQIWFNQQAFDDAPDQAKAQIGYLPENLPVYPDLTVADYLLYAARLRHLEGADAIAAVRRAIRDTELEDKVLSPIHTLSRGYKQRVGVAQAILHNPKLLILDEPTNGLDPQQTQAMRHLLKNLAKNATVVLSTHIMQEVEAICDRVLMMRRGELILDEQLSHLHQSTALLVTTSMAPAQWQQQQLNGVQFAADQHLGESNGHHRYRLPFAGTHHSPISQAEGLAAQVAQRLVEQGAALYGLTPERRDLESLFREVNKTEEVSHAA